MSINLFSEIYAPSEKANNWKQEKCFMFTFLIDAKTSNIKNDRVTWPHYLSLLTDKTKWPVRPAKTQISLGIRPDWSESSLSAWKKVGSLATQ